MNTLSEHFSRIVSQSKCGINILSSRNVSKEISYTQLFGEASTILYNLQNRGAAPGTELLIQMNDIGSFLATFWACILGRIIAVPISPIRSEEVKKKIVNISRILNAPKLATDDNNNSNYLPDKNCFLYRDIAEHCGSGELIPASPDDLAFIQFSSGSTGNPKGVMLTHQNVITNVYDILNGFKVQENSSHKWLSWLPLTHDLGLIAFHLAPVVGNMDQVLMPPDLFLRYPHLWLSSVCKYKATVTASPNFGYQYVIDHFSEEHYADVNLSHLHLSANAAEPISISLSERFQNKFKPYGLREGVITPAYGLAEASVGVSCYEPGMPFQTHSILRKNTHIGDNVIYCERNDEASITFLDVGKPFTHCQVRIADNYGNVLKEKTIGRVQIKGKNVTSGYYNNKKSTHEVITMDGWLDTGDLGFKNGEALVITGRIKDIIFVNGQNFFPHDLEAIVSEAGLVPPGKIAIAGFYNPASDKETVVAFVIFKEDPNHFPELANRCNIAIKEKTGIGLHYCVPVPKIPKTTSGKFQRYALLEKFNSGVFNNYLVELGQYEGSSDGTEPRNTKEEVLCNAWRKVLKRENTGIYDDFFKLGGDSIKATLILVEIQNQGFTIKQEYIFKMPTIAEAAQYMEEYHQMRIRKDDTAAQVSDGERQSIKSAGERDLSMFSKENIKDIYTLTPMQEGMYYFSKLDNYSSQYFQQFTYTLSGNWNEKLLDESLQQLISRHDALRTVFVENLSDRLLQVVFKQWIREFTFNDISHLDEGSQKSYINYYRSGDCNRPFNLNKDALFRLAVFKLSTEASTFYWSYHHILFDGWCATIVLRDFFSIYRLLKDNKKINLPPVSPYSDYIRWLEKQDKVRSINYWKDYLQNYSDISGFPKIKDTLSSSEKDERVLSVSTVEESDYLRIKDFTASMKTTINVFFQTAWSVLLAKYCGKNDIVFGAVTSGRPPEVNGMENMVGLFINTIPVRVTLNPSETFSNLLVRIQQNALESSRYQYSSLAQIQSAHGNKGELFDHILAYQNHPIYYEFEGQEESSALRTKISKIETAGVTNYNMDVDFVHVDEFTIRIIHNPNVYSQELIHNILEHLNNIITVVLKQPDIPICDIELLSAQERKQFLEVFNCTPSAKPSICSSIHDLFEAQVLKTPNAPAVTFQDVTLDYATLNSRANQLAHYLKRKNIAAGELIGIYIDRSVESIIAILAVWKAGGAYLPINTSQPVLRTIEVLEDCSIAHVITTDDFADTLNFARDVILLDEYSMIDQPVTDLKLTVQPDQLCYAITTSGSTGKPKAVMIRHQELSGLISVFNDKLDLKETPLHVLQMANFVFDVFLGDVSRTLPFGGHLFICPEEVRVIPQALYDYIVSNKISYLETTPALIKPLFEYMISNKLTVPSIKSIATGGDVLHMEDYRTFRRYLPENVRLVNSYGVAECTVDSSWFEEGADYSYKGHATPIGKPLTFNRLYILDQFGKMAPIGVAGELCIAGPSVGAGYLGDPIRTSEKFAEDPIVKGDRIYRTGDNGRWLPDGNMEFLGRRDFQIKIRGNRVELGEIEGRMLSFAGVTEAVAVVRDVNGKDCIVAYFVAKEQIDKESLRSHLLAQLPDYMIPSILVNLEKMPLNENKKIDRKTLKNLNISTNINHKQEDRLLTEVEKLLLNIWKKILKNEHLGIYDDFFAAGGDSIISIQIQAALRKVGYQYDLQDLFRHTTISELSPMVKPIRKKTDQGLVYGKSPLTPIQHYFFQTQKTDPHHYNHCMGLYSEHGFDKNHIRSVFNFLIAHHDALRIVFYKTDGRYVLENSRTQVGIEITYDQINVSSHDALEFLDKINKLQTDFDLQKGPLIRVGHYKCNDGDRLVIIIHHLVVDGVSWRILIDDIQTLFNQIKQNQILSLPEKTEAFIHWANNLNTLADDKQILREKSFWKKIDEAPVVPIPTDKTGEICRYKHLKAITSTFDSEKTKILLMKIHEKYNTVMEDILLTGFSMAMQATFDMENIAVSMESHGRDLKFVDLCVNRTVGWFTSYYPVILHASRQKDIDWMIKVTKENLRQIHNNGVGFGVLKYLTSSHLKQDLTFKLEPQIEFNYLGQFKNTFASNTDIKVIGNIGNTVSRNAETGTEMIVTISIPDNECFIQIDYNQTKFEDTTMQRLMSNFQSALDQIIQHCLKKEVSTLTPSDVSDENLTLDELEQINALVEDIE
jgi:amino acid adenylation domain-containing protein/non-ribosomal peptide synthase protein (TIGR01720 family)